MREPPLDGCDPRIDHKWACTHDKNDRIQCWCDAFQKWIDSDEVVRLKVDVYLPASYQGWTVSLADNPDSIADPATRDAYIRYIAGLN